MSGVASLVEDSLREAVEPHWRWLALGGRAGLPAPGGEWPKAPVMAQRRLSALLAGWP